MPGAQATDYLTTEETAALLRCSVSWLKHARSNGGSGGPPAIHLGARVVYRRVDIEEWASERARANGKRGK